MPRFIRVVHSTAPDLVVSPENARTRLARFLRTAKKSIDVYDGAATDDNVIRVLKARVAQGVRVGRLATDRPQADIVGAEHGFFDSTRITPRGVARSRASRAAADSAV